IEAEGQAMFEEVRARGLEGVVAKRAGAPYRGGRSADWLKLRVEKTGDFVVVGFTQPSGTRTGFGALHLAVWEDGRLVYAGRAGSGFSARQLEEVRAELDGIRRKTPPFEGPLPPGRGHVWVEPQLIAEVRYLTWTDDHLLRHPTFVRFREDKKIEECTRP